MQFGLFYEWPNPTFRPWKILFEEGVEQIQYSEALGFDYCLIAEHHFSNYGNSPAPLLQALYVGQRTRRLKIGTAAVILPVWQPLRLAEEVAVLDNLIDGRFLCGVGRGYQPYEMAGFGRNVANSRRRFQENSSILETPRDSASSMFSILRIAPRGSSLEKKMLRGVVSRWMK